MSYKEIVVYLDPTPDSANRLQLAINLALAHGARLIGVDACTDAAYSGSWRDKAIALADQFHAAIGERGVKGYYRGADRSEKNGLTAYSHLADLIIAPQPAFEARGLVLPGVPEDVLVGSGVPMLILPYDWRPQPLGENVVIAWKASREATRAVHDAMPFLKKAKKVTVFTFAPRSGSYGSDPEMVVNHLKAHGVAATASSWPDTGDLSAVDALFASLDTEDADLIVAGAYGHSRLFEGLFGGVSRDLTRQPSLPFLMSH